MALNIQVAELRKDYSQQKLTEDEVSANPIVQFEKWWSEAMKTHVDEVNAMTLATCNDRGHPSARIVLLKSFSEEGFIFFTNYESKKGKELNQTPYAALVFFWKELERQIRIEGIVKKISAKDSDEYFSIRPVASRISAWSSPQSTVIHDKDILEKNSIYYRQLYNGDVPRPGYWGGYIVEPSLIEFWQGRPGRLHDRIQYSATGQAWQIDRLAP